MPSTVQPTMDSSTPIRSGCKRSTARRFLSLHAFAKPFAEGFNLGREAHFNNAKIVFSRACSEPNPDYPRWSRKRIEETCWELLMNGYLNCEDLIDPVVTFAKSPESYMQYVDQHPEQSIKMGVTF